MSNEHSLIWTTSINLMGSSAGYQALPVGTTGRNSSGHILLTSEMGASIMFDLKSSSTAASCKGIEYEIQAGLSTHKFETVAGLSGSVTSSPNPSRMLIHAYGHPYYRANVAQSSSNDSHHAWVSYRTWKIRTT